MQRTLFVILLLLGSLGFAQERGAIIGVIINQLSLQLEGIEIYIVEDGQTTFTDSNGQFSFENLPFGTYHIAVDFETQTFGPFEIQLKTQSSDLLHITLEEQNQNIQLNEILIQTKTESERLKNNAIKADIVTIKENLERASSVEEIINRAPGVKIRNIGGLGSIDNIIIGGFTGNSIKFLYDDIPIDYLGSNYGLSKIPTNSLDRIEIYKGVLPTKIGIDALGSAVNFIPMTSNKTGGSITYETGSFGTQIGSVNSLIKITDYVFIGGSIFYNYSKNNYKVDKLPYRNPETGQTQYIRNRLFHNAFEQFSSEFFVQFRNLKWADLLEFKVNSYDLKKEIQNDTYSRARPFGEVYRKEKGNFIPSIKYKKYFLDNRLSLNQFLVYSHINFELFDKAKNVYYDWMGEAHYNNSGSEMGNLDLRNGYLLHKMEQITSRTYLNYLVNSQFQIESNTVFSHYNRKTNNDSFNPRGTNYNKLISNLALNSRFFDKKLESNTQIKYLFNFLSGNYNSSDDPTSITINDKDITNDGWSFSQALKFNINSKNFLRISYENTYRLPEQNELFGDNNFILANYNLKPEKSSNINFGYVFDSQKFRLELNTYYRDTKELIRLKDINQYQAMFLNLDHVKGLGVEIEMTYRPTKNFILAGNITWNDYRLSSSNDPALNNQHYKKARVANMPFYYSNASFSYNLKDILNLSTDLSFFWDYSYVHQYYLDFIEKQFEPDGFLGLWGHSKINTSRIIPVQHLHSLGMVYTRDLGKNNISISAEVKNLFNHEIYNEFKMQNPGRNFRVKLTYSF
ncbi:MAG: TonB-dependent receptor [Weeksellaceae bacterium]|nr:TonB-dependent receptor [Weeksellaceae bacterium]